MSKVLIFILVCVTVLSPAGISATLFDLRKQMPISISTIHWGNIFKGGFWNTQIPLDVKKAGVGMRFVPIFDEPMKGDEFKKHRQVILEALKAWSQVIDEDVVLRVKITRKQMERDTIAQARSYVRTLPIDDVVDLLQRKIHSLGYTNLIYPRGEALHRAMAPRDGSNMIWRKQMLVPDSIIHTLISKREFERRFEPNDDFDFCVQLNQDWKPSDFNTGASIQPLDQVSLYSVILHEIGHALGFSSSVGELREGKEWIPTMLELYRFRADEPNIDFAMTRRYFGQEQNVAHAWYDPYKIDGRISKPLFSQGVRVDWREASHWKDDFDPKTWKRESFIGVMDPSPSGSIRYSFTLADLRAFSRLGYRVNLLAKPILSALWKKPLKSGTYFGVAAQLLLANSAEYLFVSHQGVRHLITSKSVLYLTKEEAETDIGKFLDARRNYFNAFSTHRGFKLPSLTNSKSWYIFARNRNGKTGPWSGIPKLFSSDPSDHGLYLVGPWSDPLSFNGYWNAVQVAGDFNFEKGWITQTSGKAPPPSFDPQFPKMDPNVIGIPKLLPPAPKIPTKPVVATGKPEVQPKLKPKVRSRRNELRRR